MSATLITGSTDPRILDPLLSSMTYAAAEADEEMRVYEQICNLEDMSTSPIPDGVRDHRMFGLGSMQERGDTTPFAFDQPGSVGTQEKKVRFFGLAAGFSEFLLQKDMYGIIPKVLTDLGTSHPLRRTFDIAAFYDDMFAGSLFKTIQNQIFMQSAGADGSGAGHTTPGATSIKRYNALAIAAPISYTALQSVIILRQQWKNDRGIPAPAPLMGLRLLITPAMMMESDRLLDPNSRLEPTTNNNATNVLQKYAITQVVNSYTTTSNWFTLDPKGSRNGGNPIAIYDDQKLTTDTDRDPVNKGVKHDVRGRWLYMPKHEATAFGSNG